MVPDSGPKGGSDPFREGLSAAGRPDFGPRSYLPLEIEVVEVSLNIVGARTDISSEELTYGRVSITEFMGDLHQKLRPMAVLLFESIPPLSRRAGCLRISD